MQQGACKLNSKANHWRSMQKNEQKDEEQSKLRRLT
eukprot:CAMPEP_0181486850 /NCGR_PEP_ID=MMETSP1110-20121109/47461_1 /TAXON_ID=174948 /ORGANISM="Symbiodinium sp., Strain CCMP421" /LENGTH=35 /DNA_ID= /DNA_START= /DNA_END= /DNA_ORIENTATION=